MGKKIVQLTATTGITDTHLIEISKAPHAVLTDSEKATILQLKNYITGGAGIKYVELVIQSGDILFGNSIPIQLLPAVPGFISEPISGWVENTTPGTPYDTNTTIIIYHNGADRPIMNDPNILLSTVQRKVKLGFSGLSLPTETQLIGNAALMLSVDAGDPQNGDSDIKIHIFYQLVAFAY